jgi:hypothetical protein
MRPSLRSPSGALRAVFWTLLCVVCVVFSISAAEFYFVLKSGGTASYARLLEWVISYEYAFGEGSGMREMHPYWSSMPELNKIILGVHTVLASVALVLAPTQFIGSLRRRYPRRHRQVGYLSFVLGTVAMLLAIVYLLITPMERIYGGAPFAVGLWGIAVLTLYTYFAGVFHAIRGERWQHFAIMTLNFCVLLIAPGLRFWWLALGWLIPGLTQAEAHVAVLMFLGVQSMVLAIAVSTLYRGRHPWTEGSAVGDRLLKGFRQLRLPLMLTGGLMGAFMLNQVVLKFLGSSDVFGSVVPGVLLAKEAQAFHSLPWASWAYGVGCCLGLTLAPLVIWRLLDHRDRVPVGFIDALFWTGTLAAAVGHIGRSFALGSDWIRGWGGAFNEGVIGFCLLGLASVALVGLLRRDLRLAREYAIHCWMVLSIPVTASLIQALFLWFAFSFEDAYLSAAVVASSLSLSASYYYTVYGSRPARLPAEVEQRVEEGLPALS